MDDLGRRLRRIRESRNLSIYEVERRTGMHFSTISKYERNERQPSLEILRELAAVYEVPVTALIADITDLEAVLPPRVAAVARDLLERPELLEASERLAAMTDDQVRALLAFLERMGVAGARSPRAPLQGTGAAPEGRGKEPGRAGL
ncbi:MAG TPA: helix-turn-helix transcriptional regulator [Thermaerobacter sp.]